MVTDLDPMSPAASPAALLIRGAEGEVALEVADLLAQAFRRLHRGTNEALAPLGLSRTQARVIRLLADGPLRMTVIAERLTVVPRTVTDLVDGVEALGLVARRPDPEDRRATFVALTPDGWRLLDRLQAVRRESAQQVLGRLDRTDLEVLLRVLRELTTCPASQCDPATAAAGAVATSEAAGASDAAGPDAASSHAEGGPFP